MLYSVDLSVYLLLVLPVQPIYAVLDMYTYAFRHPRAAPTQPERRPSGPGAPRRLHVHAALHFAMSQSDLALLLQAHFPDRRTFAEGPYKSAVDRLR